MNPTRTADWAYHKQTVAWWQKHDYSLQIIFISAYLYRDSQV